MRTELRLPFPPSVNGLFAGKKRRFKSKRYKAWIDEAGKEIMCQPGRLNRHTGNTIVVATYTRPDKRKRDLDNLIKAVLDLLVSHGIIADDSLVQGISLEWACHGSPKGVLVAIEDREVLA